MIAHLVRNINSNHPKCRGVSIVLRQAAPAKSPPGVIRYTDDFVVLRPSQLSPDDGDQPLCCIDCNDANRQLGRFLDEVYMYRRIHSSSLS